MKRRSHKYRSKWGKLIEMHGSLCFYCTIEPASCIDHIMPVSFHEDHSIENLVPCCTRCNLIAGDNVFGSISEKRQYIMNKRKNKMTHAICTSCLLPFAYREHSPSLFLCAECYDKEYTTNYHTRGVWGRWLTKLENAGYLIEAHRKTSIDIKCLNNKDRLKKSYAALHEHMLEYGYYE